MVDPSIVAHVILLSGAKKRLGSPFCLPAAGGQLFSVQSVEIRGRVRYGGVPALVTRGLTVSQVGGVNCMLQLALLDLTHTPR